MQHHDYGALNEAKATFDDLYKASDPRRYFSVLGSLDYVIPDLANPIFKQILNSWRARSGRSATVLDLGSSYGVNAALLRYPLTFDTLRRRYSRREIMALSSSDLMTLDTRYYQSWPRASADRIVALDASRSAVRYAAGVGLVDEALAADFEVNAPTEAERGVLSEIDVVVSTGVVGYVGRKTFDAILGSARRPPWVVSFVLRMFDYSAVAQRLEEAGLVTEKLSSAVFLQRRFSDPVEAKRVLHLLRARGLDPTGLEADGMLFAELFVSRPPEAVEAAPLEEIVTVASGRNLSLGPRYVHLRRDGLAEIVSAR